jgi:hypothetical protein
MNAIARGDPGNNVAENFILRMKEWTLKENH